MVPVVKLMFVTGPKQRESRLARIKCLFSSLNSLLEKFFSLIDKMWHSWSIPSQWEHSLWNLLEILWLFSTVGGSGTFQKERAVSIQLSLQFSFHCHMKKKICLQAPEEESQRYPCTCHLLLSSSHCIYPPFLIWHFYTLWNQNRAVKRLSTNHFGWRSQ